MDLNPLHWLQSCFNWMRRKFFPTDEDHIENARDMLDKNIMHDAKALAWVHQSGWSVNGAAALRNPATRDAAVYAGIQTFYDQKNNGDAMMTSFKAHGLNNGTTTRTYLLNVDDKSLGRSDSNHKAVLMVDETTEPPVATLAFRGVIPGHDFLTPVAGLRDALLGRCAQDCEHQADQFWQGAQGDITRIMAEVAARHPGVAPQIVVAGHSYGSDAAARMIPRLAKAFPQWQDQLQLVGYGATPTFTNAEATQIMQVLGNNGNRARQYMDANDWMRNVLGGCRVGTQRELACDTGHEYKESSNLEAMMNALEAHMKSDPRHAEAQARALVAEYKNNPDSVMRELASYADGTVQSSQVAAVGVTDRSAQPSSVSP